MIVVRDHKNFRFSFDWPKHVEENLKQKINFMIISNESLAENKVKNETEQIL